MAKFRFLLPAGQVTPGGSLAPSLAPFGLDLPRLVREVNNRGQGWAVGCPLVVRIMVLPNRQWQLSVMPPPLGLCLRSLNPVRIRLLYSLLLVVAGYRAINPRMLAPQLLGSLRSRRPFCLILL